MTGCHDSATPAVISHTGLSYIKNYESNPSRKLVYICLNLTFRPFLRRLLRFNNKNIKNAQLNLINSPRF